jgi:hypothetical protein
MMTRNSKQEVLEITNPPIFLTLFNNAVINLNLLYKLLRGHTQTGRETEH